MGILFLLTLFVAILLPFLSILLIKNSASSLSDRWVLRILLSAFLVGSFSCHNAVVGGMKCKNKQGVVKQMLGMIAKLQEDYICKFGTYADSSKKLGFPAEGEDYIYSYSDISPDSYTATATSVAPGISDCGEGDDVWTINEKLSLKNIKNGCRDVCYTWTQKFVLLIIFAFFFAFFIIYDGLPRLWAEE